MAALHTVLIGYFGTGKTIYSFEMMLEEFFQINIRRAQLLDEFSARYSAYVNNIIEERFGVYTFDSEGKLSWNETIYVKQYAPLLSWREFAECIFNGSDLDIVLNDCSDDYWKISQAVSTYEFLNSEREIKMDELNLCERGLRAGEKSGFVVLIKSCLVEMLRQIETNETFSDYLSFDKNSSISRNQIKGKNRNIVMRLHSISADLYFAWKAWGAQLEIMRYMLMQRVGSEGYVAASRRSTLATE